MLVSPCAMLWEQPQETGFHVGVRMLEEVLADKVDRTEAQNQPMFRTDIDYEKIEREHSEATKQWAALNTEDRKKYRDQADYIASLGAQNPRDPEFSPARNLALVRREVQARLSSHNTLRMLRLDALDFADSLLELAESQENSTDIREIYRVRKRATGTTKNSGISSDEAARIKNCFTQGRELYLAGRNGSLMVKPLNFFYSLTAYAYGIIILNNPLRFRKDMLPGSHGMGYLPDAIKAQFGGDVARGTFRPC